MGMRFYELFGECNHLVIAEQRSSCLREHVGVLREGVVQWSLAVSIHCSMCSPPDHYPRETQ